jgi:hypothetical protein
MSSLNNRRVASCSKELVAGRVTPHPSQLFLAKIIDDDISVGLLLGYFLHNYGRQLKPTFSVNVKKTQNIRILFKNNKNIISLPFRHFSFLHDG